MSKAKKSIKDLKFDSKNFNQHTEYGTSLLLKSFEKFGAGRSINKNNLINIIYNLQLNNNKN